MAGWELTKSMVRLGAIALMVCASVARAQPGSCITELAPVNFRPLQNGLMTYVVSDYGWSDAWVFSNTFTGDPSYDVLSGDDSPNLHFGVSGTPVSQNGWLATCMDAGALTPSYPTGSPWVVQSPVHYLGDHSGAQSQIRHPGFGLDITITTRISGYQISQQFQLTNNGSGELTDLVFSDYFNVHPHGSLLPGNLMTTLSYSNGVLTAHALPGQPSVVANLSMWGSRLDDGHSVGTIGRVMDLVEVNQMDGSAGPFGPADAAGAMSWNLGPLLPGESTEFTVYKIPEPGTSVVLVPVMMLCVARRRANASRARRLSARCRRA